MLQSRRCMDAVSVQGRQAGGVWRWRRLARRKYILFLSALPCPAQQPTLAAAAGKSLSEGMESGEMLGAGCCGHWALTGDQMRCGAI